MDPGARIYGLGLARFRDCRLYLAPGVSFDKPVRGFFLEVRFTALCLESVKMLFRS